MIAVRLYTDRLRNHGESKLAARKHVGAVLGINPATLRNWIEAEQRAATPAGAVTDDSAMAAQMRQLRSTTGRARPTCWAGCATEVERPESGLIMATLNRG